jgi:DNA-binding MarR family transcriptional regulator
LIGLLHPGLSARPEASQNAYILQVVLLQNESILEEKPEALRPEERRTAVDLAKTNQEIIELINELALLGARSLAGNPRLLDARQKMRLVPTVAASLFREGRPGFLLVFDIARTLAMRGELTISEIGEITGRPLGTTSRFVDGLEAAGLVLRNPNPLDGRSKLVSLTEPGRTAVAAIREEAGIPLVRRLERLSTAERRSLARLLAKLAAPEPPAVIGANAVREGR